MGKKKEGLKKSNKPKFKNKEISQEQKIYKDYNKSKFLKIFFYCLSFPFILYLTIIFSARFLGYGVYGNYWSIAIQIVLTVWLIIGIAQLIFNKYKKKFKERVIFISVFTFVIMLLSILILSFISANIVKKVKNEYPNASVSPINKQYETFLPYTSRGGDASKYATDLANFKRVYGADFKSKTISPKKNNDGSNSKYFSDSKKDLKKLEAAAKKANIILKNKGHNYFFDGDAYYSILENGSLSSGLYADGLIFGFKQVYDIVYVSQTFEKYVKENGYEIKGTKTKIYDPDIVLQKEISEIYKPNSQYSKYINNPDTKERIKRVEGKYNLDEEKLNKIYAALQDTLNFSIKNSKEGLNVIVSIVEAAKIGKISEVMSIVKKVAGKDLNISEILTLLAKISPYVISSVKPDIMFLPNDNVGNTDVSIREYALSKYYGIYHGSRVGSVVLPKDPNGRIGKITMANGGLLASENAIPASSLLQLKADSSYMPKLHPLLLARRILISTIALAVLMLIISTYFGSKTNSRLKQLILIRTDKEIINNPKYNNLKEMLINKSVFESKKIEEEKNIKKEKEILENNKNILEKNKESFVKEENNLFEKYIDTNIKEENNINQQTLDSDKNPILIFENENAQNLVNNEEIFLNSDIDSLSKNNEEIFFKDNKEEFIENNKEENINIEELNQENKDSKIKNFNKEEKIKEKKQETKKSKPSILKNNKKTIIENKEDNNITVTTMKATSKKPSRGIKRKNSDLNKKGV